MKEKKQRKPAVLPKGDNSKKSVKKNPQRNKNRMRLDDDDEE
jgi:hypothetical protein